MDEKKVMTNAGGAPVDNDLASLTMGMRENGYTSLVDTQFMEKIAHFGRERIPERVVHAKGAGAFGYFEVTDDLTQYTCANLFNKVGKKTELFARFSTVGGERGSADTARDPRGFAVKFYTEEGNYDMVGNNTPVFFIRDAMKFPDFVHTQKRHPHNNLKDATMFWDFLSLTPESIHQVMILFSDRGTPKSYREMDGHSSHTYMWYNDKKEYVWIKYHFKTDLGFKTLTGKEAEELAGSSPDCCTQDLFDEIAKGNYPSWTVYVQIMTQEQAKKFRFNPFDVTKVWYHSEYPLIRLGKMVLNRNPENYFADVEQAAFCPSNFVRGIGPSPDKLLQGRIMSYGDTQRWRLGSNFQQIPVNAPKCPMHHYQRDGQMAVNGNGGSGPNYWPNSMGTPAPDAAFAPPAVEIKAVLDRHEVQLEDIDFEQAGELYRRVMDDQAKANLISNIAGHICHALKRVQYRQIALFCKADAQLGARLAQALKLDADKVKKLAAMTQEERVAATANDME